MSIYRVSQNYQLWRGSRGRIEKWFAYSWSPRSEMVDPPLFRPPKMSEFQHLRYCFCSQFWLNRSRRVCWYHFRSCPIPVLEIFTPEKIEARPPADEGHRSCADALIWNFSTEICYLGSDETMRASAASQLPFSFRPIRGSSSLQWFSLP